VSSKKCSQKGEKKEELKGKKKKKRAHDKRKGGQKERDKVPGKETGNPKILAPVEVEPEGGRGERDVSKRRKRWELDQGCRDTLKVDTTTDVGWPEKRNGGEKGKKRWLVKRRRKGKGKPISENWPQETTKKTVAKKEKLKGETGAVWRRKKKTVRPNNCEGIEGGKEPEEEGVKGVPGGC